MLPTGSLISLLTITLSLLRQLQVSSLAALDEVSVGMPLVHIVSVPL